MCCHQAPQKQIEQENGSVLGTTHQTRLKECNSALLLSESVLQDVKDDLEFHLTLSPLFTLPVMLIAPSMIHWSRNLR